MHKTSYDSMAQFLTTLDPETSLHILDIGSLCVKGQHSYKDLIKSPKWKYTGLDIVEGANVDVIPTHEYFYPFPKRTYDVIICGQTLEHAYSPMALVREAFRLLREGGKACFIAPSSGYEHHKPDYWRIMPDGMNFLLVKAGFINIIVSQNKEGIWRDCVGIAMKGYTQ